MINLAKLDDEFYMYCMSSIDKTTVKTPNIVVSEDAASQIRLAMENDFYNQGKSFRIHISGKGCDGFTYQTFFDYIKDEDLKISIEGLGFDIIMAPFTAYYGQNIELDFETNFEEEVEGFVVKNKDQSLYAGKFWRNNPERTPNLI